MDWGMTLVGVANLGIISLVGVFAVVGVYLQYKKPEKNTPQTTQRSRTYTRSEMDEEDEGESAFNTLMVGQLDRNTEDEGELRIQDMICRVYPGEGLTWR